MPSLDANFSGRPVKLQLNWSENVNSAGNSSTISWQLYLVPLDPNNSGLIAYHLDVDCVWQVNMGEYPYVSQRGTGLFNYDYRTSTDPVPKDTKLLGSGTTAALPHASNGSYRLLIGINAQTNDNLGSAGATQDVYLTDYTRTPSAPSAGPTLGTRTSNGTTLTIVSAVSPPLSPVGPTITRYEYQVRSSTDGVTYGSWSSAVSMATPPGASNVTGLIRTTFYQFQTRAVSSEGNGAWSVSSTATVAPAFPDVDVSSNITTLPDTGTFSIAYSGTVRATNASSITVGGGALPPGLITSSSTVSGTTTLTISGTPTAPGPFSFFFTASGAGGSTNSSTQTISVGAAGPWVKTEPVNYTSATATIAAFNSTHRLATLVLPAHGITERNQPITVAGLTDAFAALNGFWQVYSFTPGTVGLSYADATISFLVPFSVALASQAIAIGTVTVDYSRGSLNVFAKEWVQRAVGGNSVLDVAYGGGKWVTCGVGNIRYSTNLVTWNGATIPAGATTRITAAGYGSIDGVDGWLLFDGGGNLLTSFDGVTWTLASTVVAPAGNTFPVRSLRYFNGTWVAAGDSGLVVSFDGITWEVKSSLSFYGVTFSDTKWFASRGNLSSLQISEDGGVTWTTQAASSPVGGAVGYSTGRLVSVGYSGTITTSDDDGVTWIVRASGVPTTLVNVRGFNNVWFAVGAGVGGSTANLVYVSENNGTTWRVDQPSIGGISYSGVDFTPEGVSVIVGSGPVTSGGGLAATYGIVTKSAFMRIYDPTYTDGLGSRWKPLS